tara:strand:- start:1056 stop:1337 length:282 start_codon:yes stop_codon:yes gene_type:complete
MEFYKVKDAVEAYMEEQSKDSPDLWMATMSLLNAANYFSQKAPKEFNVSDEKLIAMITEMVDLWTTQPQISELERKLSKDKANLLGLGEGEEE